MTTSTIQQFLDELTFREQYGHHPQLAFDSLLQRVANQTAACMERGIGMRARMRSVAERPHDDWRITQLMQVKRTKRQWGGAGAGRAGSQMTREA